MSSIYQMSSSNTNSIYNLFYSSGNNSASVNNGIFTGGSTMLGDYSMIRSGVYKKLLKAYYAADEDGAGAEDTKNKVDGTDTLLSAKDSAKDLYDAAEALGDSSLYQSDKTDEEGNPVYDRDALKGAVKDFVNSYNDYMDSAGDLNSVSLLNKTLRMVKTTASNIELLKDVGIKIGANNKLTLDEEIFDKAEISTLSSLFEGEGSYGDSIADKASESYRMANSSVYFGKNGSSYTYNGSYSMIGNSAGLLDRYF